MCVNGRAGIVLTLAWLGLVPASAGAQTVNVWLTTDNQHTKLQPQPSVTFGTTGTDSNPVFVDETQIYQPIEGFGASFTDSAAYLLNQVATSAARDAAMNALFTRAGGGIGVSFIRNPMGASDLARTHYSYDDLPAGQTDPTLAQFSIAHDTADIIPLVQQARQLNPQLKIMGTPWSPPGWMKTSGSLIGGSLLPSMYDAFANYFVRYVQAYQAAGIPIDYLSLQNEPLFVPSDYPGMSMDAATQLVVLRDHVLPALSANGITARVLVYDHNWDRPDYPDTVLGDATVGASSQVAGTAWHGYGGTPGVMLAISAKNPGKAAYQTEHSGGTWVSDQVRADFEEITHDAQLGPRIRQMGTRPRSEPRAASWRLRYLHAAGHRQHVRRRVVPDRVLHAGPLQQVRAARRAARLQQQRRRRHQRGVCQSRRLEGAGCLQTTRERTRPSRCDGATAGSPIRLRDLRAPRSPGPAPSQARTRPMPGPRCRRRASRRSRGSRPRQLQTRLEALIWASPTAATTPRTIASTSDPVSPEWTRASPAPAAAARWNSGSTAPPDPWWPP